MSGLNVEANLTNPDAAYEALVEAHRGLSEVESAALNARLVLILANHIGSLETLKQAILLAKKAGGAAA